MANETKRGPTVQVRVNKSCIVSVRRPKGLRGRVAGAIAAARNV